MSPPKKFFLISTAAFISFSLFLFFAELLCRFFLVSYIDTKLHLDEKNLTYRYDKELGWFPKENSNKIFRGCRRISVKHNSAGFRDRNRGKKTSPRIMFLGDSFVWGYDVEQHERFTNRLQRMIPSWEVLNMGVSGYGTGQEYLLLQKYFDQYEPDIVFVVIDGTDFSDNMVNKTSRGYFRPYFVKRNGQLVLEGVPVPKSKNYYYLEYYKLFSKSYLFRALTKLHNEFFHPEPLRNADPTLDILNEINIFIKSKGSKLFVAIGEVLGDKEHTSLVDFFNKKNISYVEVGNNNKMRGCGRHWTPVGNNIVAIKIYKFLREQGIVIP